MTTTSNMRRTERIRDLNDDLRTNAKGNGIVRYHPDIVAFGSNFEEVVGRAVAASSDCPTDDHSRGIIDVSGELIVWEFIYLPIDYQNLDACDPADMANSFRILSIRFCDLFYIASDKKHII